MKQAPANQTARRRRRATLLSLLPVLAVSITLAWAQGPERPLAAPAGSMESLPARILRAIQVPVNAAAEPCGVPACASDDHACRQRVFREVLACLADGRVRALPGCPECRLPAAPTQVFRAHGGNLTLYGTFAPVGRAAGNKAFLVALSAAVERPPTRE